MSINTVGIKIGHAAYPDFHTGCTIFLCPENTVASVDVRGPAPGSREMALLLPEKPIQHINGVMLTGGSAFGLASADGAVQYLQERDIGHFTPIKRVPLVAASVVYDLFASNGEKMPDAALGYAACGNAVENNPMQGNVGAGMGVSVGKWAGFRYPMKGGFGLATLQKGALAVTAAVVVNAVGDVVNDNGTVLAGARQENGGWLAAENPYRHTTVALPPQGTNTTLCVLMTNGVLSKVEANRLAQRAHDGLAIAIRPVHTTHDGDSAYALATGKITADFNLIANMGVLAVAEAIRNGVREARSVGSLPGLKDE